MGDKPTLDDEDGSGVSSADLFGDLVDAITDSAAPEPARRKAPIKVKVAVPAGFRTADDDQAPVVPKAPEDRSSDDVADLAHALLSDEVRALRDARRTGVLALTRAEVTKCLFFQGGRIVFATSTEDKDKLGDHLIRLGRISRVEFGAAYEAARRTRKRLGEALVGAGLMNEEELGRLVALQVQKIVLSVFTWTEGEMRFHEASEPIPADLAIDVSTHRLLLEAARIFPDLSRLEVALPPPRQRLQVAARAPFDFERVPLTPAERSVLRGASEKMPVEEILARSSPRSLAVRAIYALLAGSVLELADASGAEAESGPIEGDTGTFRLAMATVTRPAGIRERVLETYEALPRSTHYAVLGVAPDASRTAIQAAFRKLAVEERDEWPSLKGETGLAAILGTLRLRRREAHATLCDAERRATYDAKLRESVPEAPGTGTAEAEPARALQLVEKAKDLLRKQDVDAAVALLLQAAARAPRDFGVQRAVAIVLAAHPSLSRTAERHFLAALELQPGDAGVQLRLALYYKKEGLPQRAIGYLKTLLSAHPGHAEARRELNLLELLESRGKRR